jgi:hypothetical protein
VGESAAACRPTVFRKGLGPLHVRSSYRQRCRRQLGSEFARLAKIANGRLPDKGLYIRWLSDRPSQPDDSSNRGHVGIHGAKVRVCPRSDITLSDNRPPASPPAGPCRKQHFRHFGVFPRGRHNVLRGNVSVGRGRQYYFLVATLGVVLRIQYCVYAICFQLLTEFGTCTKGHSKRGNGVR